MHDKFDIIWGNNDSEGEVAENKIVNEFNVRAALEKKKLDRMTKNQKQKEAYNKMLDYLDSRTGRIMIDADMSPSKQKPNEKEKQFLDAFRVIIQSGYAIDEEDFQHILEFIEVEDTKHNVNIIAKFLKYSAKLLGFNNNIVDLHLPFTSD